MGVSSVTMGVRNAAGNGKDPEENALHFRERTTGRLKHTKQGIFHLRALYPIHSAG